MAVSCIFKPYITCLKNFKDITSTEPVIVGKGMFDPPPFSLMHLTCVLAEACLIHVCINYFVILALIPVDIDMEISPDKLLAFRRLIPLPLKTTSSTSSYMYSIDKKKSLIWRHHCCIYCGHVS